MKVTEDEGGVMFYVRVVPRSSRSEIVGEHDGALKVRLASPPVDGAANADLISLLSKKLGISRSSIEIVSGHAAKEKRIRIAGINAQTLYKRLDEIL